MSGETGELIGNRIGEFLEVDGLVHGLAVGQYLRVKVRMLITKPLMRGTMVDVAEGGDAKIRWFPFEYEYLPEFCYVCGIIGHVDKDCSIRLKKGEEAQFGKWLKWQPPRRQFSTDMRRGWNNGGGRKQVGWVSGEGKHASDGPSWRKTAENPRDNVNSREDNTDKSTPPLRLTDGKDSTENRLEPKQLSSGMEKGKEEEKGKVQEGEPRLGVQEPCIEKVGLEMGGVLKKGKSVGMGVSNTTDKPEEPEIRAVQKKNKKFKKVERIDKGGKTGAGVWF
jgi:hypothetical protein